MAYSIVNELKDNRKKWLRVVSGIICVVSVVLIVAASPGKRDWEKTPWNGQLMRDVVLLRYLDSGDIQSARKELNDDAMSSAVFILGTLPNPHDATNLAVLGEQPGLRAAAKYWGHKDLPNLVILSEPLLSNTVYQALAIIHDEMIRRQNETAKKKGGDKNK